jgi:NAD(P)H-hydrate epimerase
VNAAGNLSPAGRRAVLAAAEKASALVLGPGLGKDPATHALLAALLPRLRAPLVLDADALQPDLVRLGPAPRILTPHAGEFERIALGLELRALARSLPAVVVAKAPVTRLTAGGAIYHSFFGGPILARGGSGDLLAGLAGGLLAQTPADPLLAAARAVVWHGAAADCAAHDHGATASTTTQLLDFLAPPLAEAARLT